MADVEEPLLFHSVWIRQVNEMLYSERSLANEFPLPRVAKPLRTTKPEAYIPQFLSLGPYHHSRLKKDGTYQYLGLKMSAAEAYKVISAATISRRKNLADTVENIKRIQPHIVSSYDLQIPQDDDFPTNFALMMAVDSCFLLSFLFGCLGLDVPDPTSEIDFYLDIDFSQLQVYIKCDILKLENQIPLSVLNVVFQNAREVFVGPLFFPIVSFRELLQVAYDELSPFDMRFDIYHQIPNDVINDLDREPHILGCIHRIVSRILQPSAPEGATLVQRIYGFIDKYVVVKLCGIFFCFTPPTDIDRLIKGYSAAQLARAGVKFKSFSELHENIRFEECSHTLYLPPLTIISSTQTEVFFRNLVALEFNDPARRNVVTHYVGLMDGLIDTPDDVRVLMDSDVIRRGSLMLTEEHIAKLWDGMCQPFVTGHLEPPYVLKSAFEKEVKKKYYKVKVKIRIAETWEYCYGKFLSRPWKFVALLFAIFLIILNCIQAYCSLYKCKSDN